MGRRSRARQNPPATTAATAGQYGSAAPDAVPAPVDSPRAIAIAAALVAAIFAVFAQLRGHAFLNFDDPIYVTNNEHVKAGLTADSIAWAFTSFDFNWHPLTWLTHLLDVELFGLNAGAHLLVNVAWHAASAVLLLFVLRRATRSTWRSAIVAGIFALHPLHVESVAWLAERKDVLSGFFFLLAVWFYLGYAESRSRSKYVLTCVAMALGLMAKGMLVTLPFVLLLIDYWPLRRFELSDGRTIWKLTVEKAPLFALTIAGSIVTFIAQRSAEALATTQAVPLGIRVANAFLSYASYVGKTLWPAGLAIPYAYPDSIDSGKAFAAALLILVVTAAVVFFHRRRYLLTGWLWFVGMLVPVIGLVQIGHQSMADRYTYLPQIGLSIAIVWLLADLFASSAVMSRVAFGLAAAALVVLAFVAHRQAGHWRDSETLFRHATLVTAENSAAHMRLGTTLLEKGEATEAAEHFRAAVRISPRRYVEGYVALAEMELAAGRMTEAAGLLRTALAMKDDPATRAALATTQGDPEAALREYAVALRERPDSASLRNDYAAALARADRNQEALEQYQQALRMKPDMYDARMNLGALLSRLERSEDAAKEFARAAELRPKSPEPHVYLALLHASAGRIDLAIADVRKAIAIDERDANLRLTNAIRIPFKETNIREYLAFLETQRQR